MNLLFIIVISHSITSFIVESVLLEWFRTTLKLLKFNLAHALVTCMFCTGFWVGLLLSIIFNPVTFQVPFIVNNILFAFFLANTTWFIHVLEKKISS